MLSENVCLFGLIAETINPTIAKISNNIHKLEEERFISAHILWMFQRIASWFQSTVAWHGDMAEAKQSSEKQTERHKWQQRQKQPCRSLLFFLISFREQIFRVMSLTPKVGLPIIHKNYAIIHLELSVHRYANSNQWTKLVPYTLNPSITYTWSGQLWKSPTYELMRHLEDI